MTIHYAPLRSDWPACGAASAGWTSRLPTDVTCGGCRRTVLYRTAGESLTDLVDERIVKTVRPPADVRGAGA